MEDNQFILNERTFSFGIIPAIEAIAVEIAVAQVIGEPLFKAFTETKTGSKDLTEDAQTSGMSAIALMLTKMEAAKIVDTMATVFKYVNVDGKKCDINSHFNGRNKELWIVFIQALRFNFKDFLPDSLLTSLKDKIAA